MTSFDFASARSIEEVSQLEMNDRGNTKRFIRMAGGVSDEWATSPRSAAMQLELPVLRTTQYAEPQL